MLQLAVSPMEMAEQAKSPQLQVYQSLHKLEVENRSRSGCNSQRVATMVQADAVKTQAGLTLKERLALLK